MHTKPVPQEGLKLIACICMLLDHIGAVFLHGYTLRIIGRLAFPIYCFLIAEGAAHTSNAKKYCLRLFLSALLSELPFDLLFSGSWSWERQNVMFTLLLGCLAAFAMERMHRSPFQIFAALPFALIAELLHTDYGGNGVILIALFSMAKRTPYESFFRFISLACMSFTMSVRKIPFLGTEVQIGVFAIGAILPILLYSGKKQTGSRTIQTLFYSFYPCHMLLLWLIKLYI